MILLSMQRLVVSIAALVIVFEFTPSYALGQFEALNEGLAALGKGHRLKAIRLINDAVQDDPELASMLYQNLPAISDYSVIVPFADARVIPTTNKEYVESVQASAPDFERLPAIEGIVNAAKDRQIVILNEAHDTAAHRAIGMQVAEALAKEGFEYLAIETLALPDGKAGLVELEYPQLSTGSYSKEPVFGDLIRQSVRLGYQLVAYEITPDQRQKIAREDPISAVLVREEAQANNLIETVLKDDPDAKILIFVGYSHATENWSKLEDGRELGWLAARLQRKTGIDPLTIDQVGGSYNVKTGQVDAVYPLIHKQAPIEEPTIIRMQDGSWITSDQYYGKVDLTLFLPIQQMQNGRPKWLSCDGYRRPVEVRNAEYYRETRTLLQAFREDEPEDAIPLDQVILESDNGVSVLLLPKGTYRLVSQIDDGSSITMGIVEVQ